MQPGPEGTGGGHAGAVRGAGGRASRGPAPAAGIATNVAAADAALASHGRPTASHGIWSKPIARCGDGGQKALGIQFYRARLRGKSVALTTC